MKYIILGNFIGNSMDGLTRRAYEYLLQIERYADKIDIILLVPEGRGKYCKEFSHMNVLEYGKDRKGWTSKFAVKYAKEHKRVLINLVQPFSLYKHSYICMDDVRYMEKDQGRYFDSFKFRIKMYVKAKLGIHFSEKIITVSQFSKDKIIKFFHVAEERIAVIPNGWEHIKRIKEDQSIFEKFQNIQKGHYFFTLGSLARHKNHKLIIYIAERNPHSQFVIAGGIDPEIFYEDCPKSNTDNVVFVGKITDGEIKALYSNCKAFLFPSLYEGFGIPPLEALACGAKVICSDIPVLREIFGATVGYIKPYDENVDLDALLDIPVEDSRDTLNQYSWRQAGKCWFDLLEEG